MSQKQRGKAKKVKKNIKKCKGAHKCTEKCMGAL